MHRVFSEYSSVFNAIPSELSFAFCLLLSGFQSSRKLVATNVGNLYSEKVNFQPRLLKVNI